MIYPDQIAKSREISTPEWHHVFAGLPYIDDVQRFSEEDDGNCFVALREVFTAHEMCDRFSITLLHTHFMVNDNEVLVEQYDAISRTMLTTVRLANEVSKLDLYPCSWRLMQSESRTCEFVPNQYVIFDSSIERSRFDLIEEDKTFLSAVSLVLISHQAEDRFGLRLSFPFLRPRQNEFLMEDTDCEARELSFVFESEREFKTHPSIETSWSFPSFGSLPMSEPLQMGWCKKEATFRCNIFCRTKTKRRSGTWDGAGAEYDEVHVKAVHKQFRESTRHYSS